MDGGPGRLITPEAVVLDVAHAGPGTRLLARGIDLALQLVALAVLVLGVTAATSGADDGVLLVVIDLVGSVLIIFGYPAITEAAWRGRTLGKAALGLRVLTSQGAPVTLRQTSIRSVFWLLDGLLIGPLIGIVSLVATRDTVRVGDMVAGTIVVRERSGSGVVPTRFDPGPGWAPYIGTLDVHGLGNDGYALVRALLTRAPSLDPGARDRLALDVASRVATRLRLPPQPMAPEAWLHCVASAVQRPGPAWAPPTPPPAYAPPGPPPAVAPGHGGWPGPGGVPQVQAAPLPPDQVPPVQGWSPPA